ncbi:NUDIX hydrolase [Caldicellulosiruptor obsidiansis OB47]|uniref:NUDIX hydrolase n=1 Tax=Caldicellulosiruptor obsidiansis (strain ATCC BAA-2073 / JCM 16842 / OB47) TaxID=608506 RepID=D9TKU9_CALOO|nr:NUDIX hydrolase [Caldicellulosiruptor obsidiansis]ADL42631.1 NUDIX hydrolase [Caldicellulosiruptor obsidiansis OB47]
MKDLEEFFQTRFDLERTPIASDLSVKEVTVTIEDREFFEYLKSKINVDRIGEVVFAIRDGEEVLVVRQKEYPDKIYRIPSGGIGLNENVDEALEREVKEELALDIKDFLLIGVIKYNLVWLQEHFDFYSFVFLIEKYEKDNLAKTDGEISEVIKVSLDELKNLCDILKEQKGFWGDWGKFRFYSTSLVYEYLVRKKIN